jgi:cytochrome b561
MAATRTSDQTRARGAAHAAPGAPAGYSILQIVLHWTIAALVVVQLLYNQPIQRAFDDRIDGEAVGVFAGAAVHIVLGLTILALAIVRLAVRTIRGAPPAHADKPAILVFVGNAVHALLYIFIFFMPLTGAFAWFGFSEWAAEIHEIGRLILIPLIGLHVAGALAEHFVFRNDGLMRMFRPR